jgi:hypothetical protein
MSFGQYLLNKGVVDDKQLLSATIVQIESMPSLIKVIRDESLLTDSQLVSVVEKNINEQKSFLAIILDDGLLTQDQVDQVLEKQAALGTSIAQYLINESILSMDEMQTLVGDYLENASSEVAPPNDSSGENEVEPEAESGINAAALESLKEMGMLSDDELAALESESSGSKEVKKEAPAQEKKEKASASHLIGNNEIAEIFNQEKFDTIVANVKGLSKGIDSSLLEEIHRDLKVILGISRMNNAKSLGDIVEHWEKVVDHMWSDKMNFSENNLLKVVSDLKKGIQFAWDIREVMNRSVEKSKLAKTSEWKEQLKDNIKIAKEYLK